MRHGKTVARLRASSENCAGDSGAVYPECHLPAVRTGIRTVFGRSGAGRRRGHRPAADVPEAGTAACPRRKRNGLTAARFFETGQKGKNNESGQDQHTGGASCRGTAETVLFYGKMPPVRP